MTAAQTLAWLLPRLPAPTAREIRYTHLCELFAIPARDPDGYTGADWDRMKADGYAREDSRREEARIRHE